MNKLKLINQLNRTAEQIIALIESSSTEEERRNAIAVAAHIKNMLHTTLKKFRI